MADAALWAAWIAMRVHVPQLAQQLGLVGEMCAGQADAHAAKTWQETAGIFIYLPGAISLAKTD